MCSKLAGLLLPRAYVVYFCRTIDLHPALHKLKVELGECVRLYLHILHVSAYLQQSLSSYHQTQAIHLSVLSSKDAEFADFSIN